jgi:5,10-methylenetetrahydromethanopterin reductase
MRLALTFYSVLKMPLEDIIECSIEAEEAGFEYISMAESFYRDASVLATAISSRIQRVKFGSSIFPIYTRTPFQIAMATATLNEFSRGRVGFIGLGAGYRKRIENLFGVKVKDPLGRMSEFATILKGLLQTENSFSYAGRYFHFENFPKLSDAPLHVPIYFAASGDRMLKLAGREADGVILNSIGTPDYFRHAISVFSQSVRDSGKKQKNRQEVASSIILSVAERHDQAIQAARPDVLFYLLYPELDAVIDKTPYKEEVKEIRKLNNQGKSKEALSLVTDQMVETLSVSGTPQECRDKIRSIRDCGITLPIIRVSVQQLAETDRKQAFLAAVHALKQ